MGEMTEQWVKDLLSNLRGAQVDLQAVQMDLSDAGLDPGWSGVSDADTEAWRLVTAALLAAEVAEMAVRRLSA